MATIHYRKQQVGEVEVFYREAGPADAPVVLPLHGFPTASQSRTGSTGCEDNRGGDLIRRRDR